MNGNEAQIGEIILFSVILCKKNIYIYLFFTIKMSYGVMARWPKRENVDPNTKQSVEARITFH